MISHFKDTVKYFSIKPDKLLFTHFFIFKLCAIIHSISTFFRPKQHILHTFRYIPVFLIIFVFKFPTFIHHLSITGISFGLNLFTLQYFHFPNDVNSCSAAAVHHSRCSPDSGTFRSILWHILRIPEFF